MSRAKAKQPTKAKVKAKAKPSPAVTPSHPPPLPAIEKLSMHAALALQLDPQDALALGWTATLRALDLRTWPPTEWVTIAQIRRNLDQILNHLLERAQEKSKRGGR